MFHPETHIQYRLLRTVRLQFGRQVHGAWGGAVASGGTGGGGGGWHKALVVGSVSLWRRLLASRP